MVERLDRDRLASKEAESKVASNEVIELEDDHFGAVLLERWPGLHEKKRGDVPNEAVRTSVHLGRRTLLFLSGVLTENRFSTAFRFEVEFSPGF